MRNYLRKLNWSGFIFVMMVCALGAAGNRNIDTFGQWAFLMLIFGLPISMWFLIEGRED